MKKLIFILSLAFLGAPSFAQKIVLINQAKKGVQFNFFYLDDTGGDGKPLLGIRESVSIDLNHPVLVFEADMLKNCYLAEPGDTLLLNKNGNNETVVTRKSKAGYNYNNDEFLFFRRLIKEIGVLRNINCPKGFDNLNNWQDREDKINDLYNLRLAFLSKYGQQYKISNGFRTFIKSMLSGILVQDILTLCKDVYPIHKDIYKVYYTKVDSLKNLLIKDQLAERFNTEYDIVLRRIKYLLYTAENREDYVKLAKSVSAHFTGRDKDYLLTNIFIDFLKQPQLTVQKAELYYADFLKYSPNGYFVNISKGYYQNFLIRKNASVSGITHMKNIQTGKNISWTDLIKANAGKVLYVDFWASWCAPCLGEMPASHQLAESYKGKLVKFIYLSLDEKSKDWMDKSKDLKLNPLSNYFVQGSFDAELPRQYKLTSIPRYFLIGKDGKVVTDNAPRPSDPQLKELINKLLKK